MGEFRIRTPWRAWVSGVLSISIVNLLRLLRCELAVYAIKKQSRETRNRTQQGTKFMAHGGQETALCL